MPITFGEAKRVLAQYAASAGRCDTSEEVDQFVHQVLHYLLISGQHGAQRKFTFQATKGVFTIPYDLETPEKVKIDNEVGTVRDRWFEWYPSNDNLLKDCYPADRSLQEDPNYYPTVYDLPPGGSQVATLGTTQEDDDAHLIVQGKDTTGREIVTNFQGEQLVGAYLAIKKGVITYTPVSFGQITSINKVRTKGYVQLLWYNPLSSTKGFLADYSPFEEIPQYRRFKLTTPCSEVCKVTVLGRIRLKSYYGDKEVIPFDNLYSLTLAAQAVQAQHNDNYQGATAKDNMMQQLIERENATKRIQNGKPIEVNPTTASGRIRNIIRSNPWG